MVRRVVKRCRPVLAILAVIGGAGRLAHAHPEQSPQMVNQYVSVGLAADQAEITLARLYGLLPGGEMRARLDQDGDGEIGAKEIAGAVAKVERDFPAWLQVTIDGQLMPLVPQAGFDLGPVNRTGPGPLVIEVRAAVPLSPGEHRLRIEPLQDPPRLGESEIALDLSADWILMASVRGESPLHPAALPETRFLTTGPRLSQSEDRSVTFLVRARPKATSDGGVPRVVGVLLVLAALAAIGVGATLWRHRS